jgi:hypothetical protein
LTPPRSPSIQEIPLDVFDDTEESALSEPEQSCQWCSAAIPAAAPACPMCGAKVVDPNAVLPALAAPVPHVSSLEDAALSVAEAALTVAEVAVSTVIEALRA